MLAAAIDPTDPTVIVVSQRVPTPLGGPAIVEAITAAARQVLDDVDDKGLGPVAGVGVGLPGLIDLDGCLRSAPNLHGGVGASVRQPLADALELPVVVDNDANCAAWAEVVAGAGVGATEVLLVTLGTGIGGGLVVKGRLHHGAHGFAGEPGHMVVDPNGPPVPVWPPGVLGALRLGKRSGLAGSPGRRPRGRPGADRTGRGRGRRHPRRARRRGRGRRATRGRGPSSTSSAGGSGWASPTSSTSSTPSWCWSAAGSPTSATSSSIGPRRLHGPGDGLGRPRTRRGSRWPPSAPTQGPSARRCSPCRHRSPPSPSAERRRSAAGRRSKGTEPNRYPRRHGVPPHHVVAAVRLHHHRFAEGRGPASR